MNNTISIISEQYNNVIKYLFFRGYSINLSKNECFDSMWTHYVDNIDLKHLLKIKEEKGIKTISLQIESLDNNSNYNNVNYLFVKGINANNLYCNGLTFIYFSEKIIVKGTAWGDQVWDNIYTINTDLEWQYWVSSMIHYLQTKTIWESMNESFKDGTRSINIQSK